MSKFHTVASLTSAFEQRYAQAGSVDLQAGTDPEFDGEKVGEIQAAGVLSFNTAGKLKTAKALKHFMVGGETVKKDDLCELPEDDFKRMGPDGTGQVREATADEIADAQKAAAKTK